jgi:hypothetical protein
MSFFEDASLVLIPSAQKTSKVYSVKPTDGTGDLTFTRSNDTASRVASNGLIEKVRTNLILQSNTFSNASWGKNSCTVTSGQAGYDGSTNAWLLSSTATAGSSYVSQGYTSSTIVTRSVAQLETGDIATEPILTTTAAVSVGPVANVPRLDYLGSSCPRLLLEPQRTNRLC